MKSVKNVRGEMKMLFGVLASPGKIKKLDCGPSELEDLLSEIGGVVQFEAGSEEEFTVKKKQWEKFFGGDVDMI
jgi:hypothetical protein